MMMDDGMDMGMNMTMRRRRRELSHEEKRELATELQQNPLDLSVLMDGGYLDGKTSTFYAFNMDINNLKGSSADTIEKALPSNWLTAEKEDMMFGTPATATDFFMSKGVNCGLCDVRGSSGSAATVSGAGASQCAVSEDCSPASIASTPGLAEVVPTLEVLGLNLDGSLNYPPITSHFVELSVSCSTGGVSDCTSAKSLQDALKTMLPTDVKVSVVKDELDVMFTDDITKMVDKLGDSGGSHRVRTRATTSTGSGSGCDTVSSFKAILISLSDNSAQQIKSLLDPKSHQLTTAQETLLTSLTDLSSSRGGATDKHKRYAASTTTPTGLCDVTMDLSSTNFRVPSLGDKAINSFGAFGESSLLGSAKIGPSVEVVKADETNNPLGPTNPGVIGTTYDIILHNFDAGQRLRVEVMAYHPDGSDSTSVTEQSRVVNSEYTYIDDSQGSRPTGDGSENTVAWVPGTRYDGGGSYFIKVTDLDSGVVEASNTFALVREARRRLHGRDWITRMMRW